jgi:16S rRNA (guanine966-N2)-methyltransferase
MRVIAGTYRSRRLKGPGSLRLRPTSDQLRETLFNVLGPSVEGPLFIDLFAGTGAVGIEAISRGARETILIEAHGATARLIRENLKALGIHQGVQLLEADVVHGLQKLTARHIMADFVYLDPPYQEADQQLRVLEFLDTSHLVAPAGWVIAEHHHKTELPGRFDRLERTRLLERGDAALSFYRLAAAA